MARKTSPRNGRQSQNIELHSHGRSPSFASAGSATSRRQRQAAIAAGTRRWSWTRIFKIIGASCALMVGLLAIAWQYMSMYPGSRVIQTSVVLRNHINTALLRIEQKNRIDALAFTLNDPLANLITSKMRPIQERIASLRVQCSQYEKMEQIAGGPTQFIQSSLYEIRTDIIPRTMYIHNEANVIMKENADRMGAMTKTFNEMEEADELQADKHGIGLIESVGVFFSPNGDIPQEELEKAKRESSLEHVTGLVEDLADMYEAIDRLLEKAERTLNDLTGFVIDLSKLHEIEFTKEEEEAVLPYLTEIMDIREKITEFKKKNNKYLQLFEELNNERHRNLLEAFKQLHESERYKTYLQLKLDIAKDIGNLKIRIQNLGHLYAKQQFVS